MRLFTALDLPREVAGNLERLLERLRPLARLRWSPAANLHITTKFIGEWPEERLAELEAALRAMPGRAEIDVHIHEVGFFPNARSPRNFWCGIEAPGLAELAADTDRATASLGIASEKRAYSPHLTLARMPAEKADLRRLHEALALPLAGRHGADGAEAPLRDRATRSIGVTGEQSLEFGRFVARGFFLYRSQLKPSGSVYTKLSEFPFSK